MINLNLLFVGAIIILDMITMHRLLSPSSSFTKDHIIMVWQPDNGKKDLLSGARLYSRRKPSIIEWVDDKVVIRGESYHSR